jgi:cellulose synthase/poly-beta-1,6-N-acetylglucosamine synthase-like glycosyltransferase
MAYRLTWHRQQDPRWYPAVFYVYLVVATGYMVWRTAIVNWHVWYGPLLYAAELYGYLMTLLFLGLARRMYVPAAPPKPPHAAVDVLIPTYNEPLTVLEPVVVGALRIRGVHKVLVLDDGNRPEVRIMAERHGAHYVPRTTNEHAKAGNLNNGLGYTSAPLLILLDADHVPLPDFIEQTAGYFADSRLAIVQSPQTFYNTGTFLFRNGRGRRSGWSEQRMFYDCIQPAKNRWNAAFFVGTSAMLRRGAIDSIGGFATGTATEDIHTSLRLHAKGWKSAFLPHVLAYGLEADSYKEFYKQRKRWAAGSLGLLMRSPDSPLRAKGLSLAQRLNYINATLAHLQGVQKLCFFIVPIATVLWGISPVTSYSTTYIACFLVCLGVSVASTWAYSRGSYHPLYNEAYALASMPAHVSGLMGIIKVQKKFAVSSKLTAGNEQTWLKALLWALFAMASLAFIRDVWLYAFDNIHTALLVCSLVFTVLNGSYLFLFLHILHSYEHGKRWRARVRPPDIVLQYVRVARHAFNPLPGTSFTSNLLAQREQ